MTELNRRRFLGGVGVTALGAALAACGGSGTGSGGSSLTYMDYDNAEQIANVKKVLAAFRKDSGVKVALDNLSGSGAAIYPGKVRTALLGGSPPDVFRIWGGSIGAPFATAHQVIDLAPYYERYGWDAKLLKGSIGDFTYDGVKYGVPVYASAIGVYYRKDMLAKAGTTVPTSYDELEATNAALVKAGVTPFLAGGKYGWYLMRFFEYFLETVAGPELHDQLLQGKTSWDRTEVVDAFAMLKKWTDKKWFADGVLGLDPSQVESNLVAGKGAMVLDGQWVEGVVATADAATQAEIGTFIPPTGQSTLRFSGFSEGLMIPRGAPNKDQSAKFVDFFLRATSQAQLGNSYSTVKAYEPDAKTSPLSLQWQKWQNEHAHYMIQDQALSAEAANTYFSVQSDVMQGKQSPKDAAKAVATAVSKKG
ncbi:ABC transporter substrate-binding protein [Streptomyces sp. NBC_00258]|uniref:ABC transporter substrate-binding protein n=1 Tax=Streptomyces sp. NBC_00258 TaxID=2903642 RepID=UPI002E290264|nr:extracellular solute-binding protein [Streptomyces sp. NBC_00258]